MDVKLSIIVDVKDVQSLPLSDSSLESNQCFPRKKRLLNKAEYQYVFDKAKKFRTNGFVMLFRESQSDTARLGIIIAKRDIKRSVDRNRLKRIIRESFRLHHNLLPSIDMIIMAKYQTGMLSNEQLLSSLDFFWRKLGKGRRV